MKVGIIGGTGVYDPQWLTDSHELSVDTPYGTVAVTEGTMAGGGEPVLFMNRHGLGHAVPPHRVNYRANLWAMAARGVKRVVATAAVGSLNLAMGPGSMVLVDQFLDFTKSRPTTFFDGGETGVVHSDMTEPYCRASREATLDVGKAVGVRLVNRGVYVTTEGPRFETPAEIRAFRLLGGDVVGMTGVPEVVLARELGLCYTSIALVTNFAAGISPDLLTHEEVLEAMADNVAQLRTLLGAAIPALQVPFECACPPPPATLSRIAPR
ncbi:S-methyl-5'-thioadenosine phosphorylase [Sulfobacillus harzensis]|uniref:Probable 6-oxopurine nucleoside phosphorylase n=1 Tax=Sulfobacillus harzensis TaxID=2729629 RepID=A0A7Y0L2V8_9FIRM|nr:S-methyl-5'-thioadenosine phosphorylase [Sulfobacillus harzensis]NMP22283.1 S-methyl-5'-thioadenosine phosphorylase [Sulfobacillus harzensis]